MNPHTLYNDFYGELLSRTHYLTEDSIRYYFFACMLMQDPSLDNYIMELPYALPIAGGPTNISINAGLATPISTAHNPQQELDMYYVDSTNHTSWCIEFKFHRNPSNKSAFAHTDGAGRIFNDIKRLQLIQPLPGYSIRRLFVYVTDDEMHNYFNVGYAASINKDYRSIIKDFYNVPVNIAVTPFIFDNNVITIPKTFLDSANDSFATPHINPITINVIKRFDMSFITNCPSFKMDPKTGNRSCHILIYEAI